MGFLLQSLSARLAGCYRRSARHGYPWRSRCAKRDVPGPMNLLRLVFRNLIRQPRRTILTTVTFAVAAFIFNVLVAIPSSMDMILRRTSESLRLYSYNADGRYLGLPARYCRTIDALPHVVACT